MTERELSRDLRRLIRGELSSREVQRMAERAGFQSFAELCESKLPEELDRIDISTRDLITRIDRHRHGEIDLQELWQWADELYNISFNHRIAYEPDQEDLILTALSVMSVILNTRLFPVLSRTTRALEYLRASLVRRHALELRHIFRRAFEGLPVAHLATKAPDPEDEDDPEGVAGLPTGEGAGAGDAEEGSAAASEPSLPRPDLDLGAGPDGGDDAGDDDAVDAVLAGGDDDDADEDGPDRFADVVLLDRPFDADSDLTSQYSWVIAFSVVTKDLFLEELKSQDDDDGDGAPGSGPEPREAPAAASAGSAPGAQPERDPALRLLDDRIPYLRRLVPNFHFARYKPLYVCDGDGIAEIALDAPSIGPDEVRYAAKLFAMNNRLGKVYLDGERLKALQVRPLGEKRRRRRPKGPR